MLHACQHQNISFETSLVPKLSNTPKIIFISHLQPLQISNKAKFHSFFGKFSHLKLKSAPTQDKFLDFLQNEFWTWKWFLKRFSIDKGQARCACAGPAGPAPSLIENLFKNHLQVENSFCKKSRNLSWVGSDFSLKLLKCRKSMKFVFFWNLKQLQTCYENFC